MADLSPDNHNRRFPVPDRPVGRSAVKSVIVVGAGAIGLCTAAELAGRGIPVTIVERGEIGSGSSFGNAGLISLAHPPLNQPGVFKELLRSLASRRRPLHLARLNPAMLRFLLRFGRGCSAHGFERNMQVVAELSRLTMPLFRRYQEKLGLSFEYNQVGYMDVYRNERLFQRARATAALIEKLGFAERVLTGGEARELEPALKSGVVGAIRHPDSAFANPGQFLQGLGKLLQGRGVEIRTNSPVQSIWRDRRGVRGVKLAGGQALEAQVVVVACGLWSSKLARTAGVRAPMRAGKGYHIMIEQPEQRVRSAIHLGGAWLACTPMQGELRIAGLLDLGSNDLSMPEERLNLLRNNAAEFLEGIAAAEITSKWAGLRPCTADGLPIIGFARKAPGLFLNTGHAMMGFWSAPASGKLAAQAICQGTTEVDLRPMAVGRF